MLRFHWLAVAPLLILLLPISVPAPASAAEYETAAACAGAFEFTNAFPEQRVLLVPSQLREHMPATVCVLDFVYVTHVAVTQDRQHLTVTLYDNGFSWSPNPPIVVSGELPSLSAGSYSMDVIVTAGFAEPPSNYPYTVATDIPVIVAGPQLVATTPMLNGHGLLAVILTLASAALLRMRGVNAPRKRR